MANEQDSKKEGDIEISTTVEMSVEQILLSCRFNSSAPILKKQYKQLAHIESEIGKKAFQNELSACVLKFSPDNPISLIRICLYAFMYFYSEEEFKSFIASNKIMKDFIPTYIRKNN
ncbi:MAG: hypothetical protein HRT89_12430 [Lentisphaeria bacterium]|nr:hypothetical protein [Lentisphaeria bacterium]NQZ68863.1 hypothetical protein [Lentisphaeria bacterium]